MSEMKPLLDESVSPRAAHLLRSAENDGPEAPRSAEARTLAAIALLPAAELAAPTFRTGRVLGSFSRLSILGVLAAVAVFGAVIAVRAPSTAPASELPSSSENEVAIVVPVEPSALPPAPAAPEAVRVDDLPAVDDVVAAPRLASASKAPSRPGLEDELEAIDRARGALASGHPDVALARVQTYQRTFRAGRFSEEADALEVQALAALGRRTEARAKGERFLASYPGSPYERRVRSSIPSDEVTP